MTETDVEEKGEIQGIPYRVTNNRPPKGWRYFEIYDFLVKNNIPQMPFKEAIMHILNARYLPSFSKRGIKEITVYPEARILSLRCLETDIIFRKRWTIAKNTGWYPNITGVRLTGSRLSKYVDRFLKNKDLTNLKTEILEKLPIMLEPIAASPNKNSYILKIGTYNILLDAAMDTADAIDIGSRNMVDLVIITHTHYDHTQSLYDLYNSGLDAPLLATATTIDYIVQKSKRKDKEIIEKILRHAYSIPYNTSIEIADGVSIELFNAGHMPGSAMVLISVDGHRILYTGDFFLRDRLPVGGAMYSVEKIPKPVHTLIIDCTFVDREFPEENQIFLPLMEEIFRVWRGKGNILISADLGNTEIMMYLKIFSYFSRLGLKPPVYMDPQTIRYMRVLKSRINDLLGIIREFDVEIIDPFSSVMRKELRRNIDILNAISKPSVIISHPNTLDTPPITTYLKYIGERETNLIVLTGPQRSGIGKHILSGETKFTIRYRPLGKKELVTEDIEIKAKVFNLNFKDKIIASHADRNQINFMIDTLKPEHVIPFHASFSQLRSFIKELNNNGIQVSRLSKLKPIVIKD